MRGNEAVAEDEDQRPGLRQLGDQTFQLARGLADTRDLVHAALLTRLGVVAAKNMEGRYP